MLIRRRKHPKLTYQLNLSQPTARWLAEELDLRAGFHGKDGIIAHIFTMPRTHHHARHLHAATS